MGGSCKVSLAAIRTVKIGRRIVSAISPQINNISTMEIDNHADTTVLGRNCLPIQDYNRPVDVSGWDESQGSVECPTISGAVAYDHLCLIRHTY